MEAADNSRAATVAAKALRIAIIAVVRAMSEEGPIGGGADPVAGPADTAAVLAAVAAGSIAAPAEAADGSGPAEPKVSNPQLNRRNGRPAVCC